MAGNRLFWKRNTTANSGFTLQAFQSETPELTPQTGAQLGANIVSNTVVAGAARIPSQQSMLTASPASFGGAAMVAGSPAPPTAANKQALMNNLQPAAPSATKNPAGF